GPAHADDMLVQVLAAAYAQEEAAGHERRRGRCRVGDDRGVDAHGGTGDAGAEPQALGFLSDRADDGPDEGAVPLPVDPGMIVVGDEGEGEPGLFRLAREAHQRRRVVLFAGEGVSDLSHAVTPLPRTLTVDP